MKKFTSKKINTLILIVFVYVSVKNLLSFNDSEMEIVQQIDNYKTFLLENQFNDEKIDEIPQGLEKNRLELVKKEDNKKEDLKPINDIKSRRIISTSICLTLLSLLIRVDLTNVWSLSLPQNSIGEESTIRIGEHLFSDYLLPFEVASVLLLMAMIGAIVLARRDVMSKDISTGLPVDQELIEKSSEQLLTNKN